jgi:copper chaperone CopZ
MSCAMCAPAAKKALKKVDGVKSAEIAGDCSTVVVEEKVKETDLVKAIESAGFTATVVN